MQVPQVSHCVDVKCPASMYYDLDVDVTRDARSRTLQTLSQLGYDVVAFSTTIADATTISPEQLPQRISDDGAIQSSARKQVRP